MKSLTSKISTASTYFNARDYRIAQFGSSLTSKRSAVINDIDIALLIDESEFEEAKKHADEFAVAFGGVTEEFYCSYSRLGELSRGKKHESNQSCLKFHICFFHPSLLHEMGQAYRILP